MRPEQRRIDEHRVQRDGPVQVWTGYAPRCADLAENITHLDPLAGSDTHLTQMTIQRDQALAMIDKHRVAGKEVITGVNDTSVRGDVDRRTSR
jgi:hypothetical protein